jgi:hypothetical protein
MGETISSLKYHEGFLTRQVLSLSSIAFHPRRLSLALNTGTGITIFRSELKYIPEI